MDIDVDPLSLPEMHEHMIRSPPPTNWPKSPNFKIFQFPHSEDETISVEVNVSIANILYHVYLLISVNCKCYVC